MGIFCLCDSNVDIMGKNQSSFVTEEDIVLLPRRTLSFATEELSQNIMALISHFVHESLMMGFMPRNACGGN